MKTKLKIATGIAVLLILAGTAILIFPSSHLPRSQTPHAAGTLILKNQLVFAGYKTPEATIESIFWAMMNGNYKVAIASVPKEQSVKVFGENSKQFMSQNQRGELQDFASLQIIARKNVSADKVELKLQIRDNDQRNNSDSEPGIVTMTKIGNEWKLDFNAPRGYITNWGNSGDIVTFVQ